MLLNALVSEIGGTTHSMTKQEKQTDSVEKKTALNQLLVNVGQDQDRKSFIALFNHFAPRIKSFLIKAGLQPETADELAQETMLTIWNKASSYDPKQAAASTWIFTIARNKRIDVLRKLGRAHFDSINEMILEDDGASPIDIASDRQESEKISEALKKLPEEQLTLIKKSFFEDKSHAAIAEETGLPLGTVKSRIRLALERLRHQSGVKELWN